MAETLCPGCAGPITFTAFDPDGIVVNFHCPDPSCAYGKLGFNEVECDVEGCPAQVHRPGVYRVCVAHRSVVSSPVEAPASLTKEV